MELTRIVEQSPWWTQGDVATDPHLARFEALPVRLCHPVEAALDLGRTGIYVLRGPRQIGKTTLLKRKVRELLPTLPSARQLVYFALDVGDVRSHRDLLDLVRTCVERHPRGSRVVLLLDEITFCADWALGLKAAFDLGLLEHTTVVVTGSHSIDLRKGHELLPGRRGDVEATSDLEMGPFGFRDVLAALQPGLSCHPSADWTPSGLFQSAEENQLRFPRAAEAFETFLLCGGMPIAFQEVVADGVLSSTSAAVYRQAVVGDLLRAGKSETLLRELLRAVVALGGESIDWQGLSERTSVGSRATLADYLDLLERCYVLAVLHQPTHLGSSAPAPRKPRKLHFRDPFFRHVFTAWVGGHPEPQSVAAASLLDPVARGRLVESTLAGQLYPRFAELYHWRGDGEIDLIGVEAGGRQVRVEVKYQEQITSGDKRVLKRTGGGIVVSKKTWAYDRDGDVAVIPAAWFLASLPE
jgi:predicted AAA+ superfamily ATPase